MAIKKALMLEDKNKKLQKVIKTLKKKEHWMKWAIGVAAVIILLLLLLLGYATDWTRGLHKASTTGTTPISTDLDAQTTKDSSSTPNDSKGSSSDNGATTETGNASTGTSTTNSQGTSETSKETNTSSTTNNTNNTSTTTNNATTPQPGILSLYADSSVGETLNTILDRATSLGVPASCTSDLVLEICVFQQDGEIVTVKSLLLNGLVTSIIRN